MDEVVVLAPVERTPRDLDRLLSLGGRRAGPAGAAALEDRLEALAETLSRVSAAFRSSDMDRVSSGARDAADLARALGLNRTFRVGQAVATLAQGGDSVALAANVARLVRLGDQALLTIWHHQDSLSEP